MTTDDDTVIDDDDDMLTVSIGGGTPTKVQNNTANNNNSPISISLRNNNYRSNNSTISTATTSSRYMTASGPATREALVSLQSSIEYLLQVNSEITVSPTYSSSPNIMTIETTNNYDENEILVLQLEYECASLTSRQMFQSLLIKAKHRNIIESGSELEARIKLAASVYGLVETDPDIFEHISVPDFQQVASEVGESKSDEISSELESAFDEILSLLKVQACMLFYFQYPEESEIAISTLRDVVDRLIDAPSSKKENLRRVPELKLRRVVYTETSSSSSQPTFNADILCQLLESYDFEHVFGLAKSFVRALQTQVFGLPKLLEMVPVIYGGNNNTASKRTTTSTTTTTTSSSSTINVPNQMETPIAAHNINNNNNNLKRRDESNVVVTENIKKKTRLGMDGVEIPIAGSNNNNHMLSVGNNSTTTIHPMMNKSHPGVISSNVTKEISTSPLVVVVQQRNQQSTSSIQIPSSKISSPKPTTATTTTSSSPSIINNTLKKPTTTNLTGRIKFSYEEEEALKNGVQKYGEGQWHKILAENIEIFSSQGKVRTSVDLKDKWRNLKRML
jgi:hypothetical protein